MSRSRPVTDLCCIARATVFNVCLADEDLRRLDAWDDRRVPGDYTPAVRNRAALHLRCRTDEAVAGRLSDLLDLRYVDTVLAVRGMGEADVAATVDLWVAEPMGEALPGLLWALCTDPREAVRGCGVQLCHEAMTQACRGLVEGAGALACGGAGEQAG
jgi:hypothetical protein